MYKDRTQFGDGEFFLLCYETPHSMPFDTFLGILLLKRTYKTGFMELFWCEKKKPVHFFIPQRIA